MKRHRRTQVAIVAIGLASVMAVGSSPAMSDTVASDADTGDLLAAHLTYARQFRSQFDFLSTDQAHVESLVADGGVPASLIAYGLEMTEGEWAEMERRLAVIARIPDIKPIVTGRRFDAAEEALELPDRRLLTGPIFSGIWQDHMDGGRLKLAVTDVGAIDREALYGLFPRGSEDLVIIEQSYSLDELYTWRDVIWSRISERLLAAGVGFSYSDLGVRLQLELYPGFQASDLDALLEGVPQDEVVFVPMAQGPEELDLNWKPHGSTQMAGLEIGVYGSGWFLDCTWGLSGHTSSFAYLITAGHCVTPAGTILSGYGARWVKQNPTAENVISASNAFVYARNKDGAAKLDHARIQLHGNYANSNGNKYHGSVSSHTAHDSTRTTSRLNFNYHAVGQTVCASLGATGEFKCGVVTSIDTSGTFRGNSYVNRVKASICGTWGDSGAGVIDSGGLNATIHGLLTDGWPCDEPIYPNQGILFEKAWYVKAYIGASSFDFNCVWSGSWWAPCPVVNS